MVYVMDRTPDDEESDVLAIFIHDEYHFVAEDWSEYELLDDELPLGEQCDECGWSVGRPGPPSTVVCNDCGMVYQVAWRPSRLVVF